VSATARGVTAAGRTMVRIGIADGTEFLVGIVPSSVVVLYYYRSSMHIPISNTSGFYCSTKLDERRNRVTVILTPR
jgi:hypothetical protein